MSTPDSRRIAILGAGPIGLEAALYARRLGFETTVYESGQIGEHLRQWGHVRLFSPFGMNTTSLGRKTILAEKSNHPFPADTDCITGHEHLNAYLLPLAATKPLADVVENETRIIAISRQGLLKGDAPGNARRAKHPFRLLVQQAKNGERIDEADVVLDCTGTYSQPCWMGDGGMPARGERAARPQIVYILPDVAGNDRKLFSGNTTMVVGSGYSAATTVCRLAELADEDMATWVVWVARSPRTQPIKRITNDALRERDQLAVKANTLATRDDANVEYHPDTFIESVEILGKDQGFRVTARSGGEEKTWQVDRIIANVGYSPNREIYQELQMHECYASLGPMKLAAAILGEAGHDCLKQSGHGPESLRNPEPNFFVLGAKSYGRNSNFLLRVGFEQVRDVFTMITGDKRLDLYK